MAVFVRFWATSLSRWHQLVKYWPPRHAMIDNNRHTIVWTHVVPLFVEVAGRVDDARQSEVGDLDDQTVSDEHVPCRQVTMDYLHPFNQSSLIYSAALQLLITHPRQVRLSPTFVSLFIHTISQTKSPNKKITKFDTEMLHHESRKPIYFGVKVTK